jgi:hypothetical protein
MDVARIDCDVFLEKYLTKFDPPDDWKETRREFARGMRYAKCEKDVARTVSRAFTKISLGIARLRSSEYIIPAYNSITEPFSSKFGTSFLSSIQVTPS